MLICYILFQILGIALTLKNAYSLGSEHLYKTT